jgi:capsular exopolysaccharide synthesis family protein
MPGQLTSVNSALPPSAPPFAALPGPRPAGPQVNYAQLAWKGKWWILLFMILGIGAGLWKTVRQQPMYRAGATVELLGTNEGVMGLSLIDPQSNASANAANVQTQIYILTSRSMLQRVIERVGIEMTPVTPPFQGWFAKIRSEFGFVQQEPVAAMRDAIQQAASSVDVRPVGASRLLSVTCTSSSPEAAASFLNALTSEYIAQSQQVRATVSSRTTQWLEGQIEETKSRLEQSDTKLQNFIHKNGIDVAREQSTAPDPRVQQLQMEAAAAAADRVNRQARLDLAKSGPVESVADVLDDGGLKAIREKLTEARRERANLLSVYTPENPRVKRVEAQVAELENMLNTERGNLLRRLQNDYEAAVKREKAITGAYTAQSRALYGNLDKAAEYALIKREADTARQLYNTLLQQLNQSNIVAALPASYVRVIDPALPPSTPYEPAPMKNLAMGTFGGAAVAAGLLALREFYRQWKLKQVFSAPGHSRDLLNLPELGVIPSRAEGKPKRALLPRWPRSSASAAVIDANGTQDIAAWNGRPSLWAESFRFVLTSVIYGKRNHPHSVLIVTSPGPGDGKTTLVSNLAIASAESGRRVLVIDADVRKPRLHHVFDVPGERGLKELLGADGCEPKEYTQPTKFTNVHVMPAGCVEASDSGELLFSPRIAPLLKKLREMFDLVLIDTAPALLFSDARRLGQSSDGVVLVVRAGQTSRDSALMSMRSFADANIPVIGTVLNDCGDESMNGYTKYYSQYAQTQ